MLYRLLLIMSVALGLAACVGQDDYEKSIQGEVAVLPDPEPEPDLSILVNGGLENGDTANWAVDINDGTADISVVSEQYFEGSSSLKVSIETVGANPWDIEAGPSGISVSSDMDYRYEAWVLGTPGAVANFTASLPVEPWTTFGSQRIEVTSRWQKVAFTFSIPEGVTEIRLPIQLSQPENEGKDIYIDSVSLVPLSKDTPPFRPLPVDAGWRVSEGLTVSYGGGVSYSPTAQDHQLLFDLFGPENYHEKTFTFEIVADQAFIDSGATLQPFVQLVGDGWHGTYCSELNGESLGTEGALYSCKADKKIAPDDAPAFDLTEGMQLQVGVQTKGSPAGTITIVSWGVDLPPLSDVPLTSGWSSSVGEPTYDSNGVSYSPVAADQQLTFELSGPDNLEGAEIVFTIAVPQEFIDTGTNLQPFAQFQAGGDGAEWGCWIDNADLSTTPKDFSCVLDEPEGAPFNLVEGQTIKVGIQTKDSTPVGTVTVSKVMINYPEVPLSEPAEGRGWAGDNATAIYGDGQVSFNAAEGNFYYLYDGPQNLMGNKYTFTLQVDQAFIDSGADLQPFYQQNFGSYGGAFGTIASSELSLGDITFERMIPVDDDVYNLAEGESARIGVQGSGSPAGTITIKKIEIIYGD